MPKPDAPSTQNANSFLTAASGTAQQTGDTKMTSYSAPFYLTLGGDGGTPYALSFAGQATP